MDRVKELMNLLAQELADRRVRMNARNLRKARVAALLAGPVEQRQIHHAIDDRVARALPLRPRADKARRIEAACQQRGREIGRAHV